jgi:hypothetical protein
MVAFKVVWCMRYIKKVVGDRGESVVGRGDMYQRRGKITMNFRGEMRKGNVVVSIFN